MAVKLTDAEIAALCVVNSKTHDDDYTVTIRNVARETGLSFVEVDLAWERHVAIEILTRKV